MRQSLKFTVVLRERGVVVNSFVCESREHAHEVLNLWLDSGAVQERRSGSVLVDPK